MDEVTVSRHIDASPDQVWSLISDPTRMHEFSPENVGARWVGQSDHAIPGARFRGSNRQGMLWWMTLCEVTVVEPTRTFAFEVRSVRLPVSTWRYEITPDKGGSLVTETWHDRRGRLMRTIGTTLTGVRDRAAHNRDTMTATLDSLAAALS